MGSMKATYCRERMNMAAPFLPGNGGVDFKSVEGDFSQNGEVGGGFAAAGAAAVLAHDDVVEPRVQPVFDRPVGAGEPGEGGGGIVADGLLGAGLIGFDGGEIVAALGGDQAGGGALGMGGVGGDDSVFQTGMVQQERGLDDFAAFLRDAALGKDEALAGARR